MGYSPNHKIRIQQYRPRNCSPLALYTGLCYTDLCIIQNNRTVKVRDVTRYYHCDFTCVNCGHTRKKTWEETEDETVG